MNRNLPGEPEKIASVERIIEAATKLFSQRPMETVSLNEIAEKAEVKVPLLVYHFKSKADLFRIVFERLMIRQQEFVRPIHELWAEKGAFTAEEATEWLIKIIGFVMDGLYGSSPDGYLSEKTIIIENLYPCKFHDQFYDRYFKRYYEILAALIMAVTGKKDREKAILQATTIFGQVIGFRVERELLVRMNGMVGFSREEVEQIKTMIIRNVFLILERPVPAQYQKKYNAFFPATGSRQIDLPPPADWSSDTFSNPDLSNESVRHIIRTAAKIFTRLPVDMVSLRTIAREAGVKLTTITYHFKSKADLYRVVYQRVMEMHEQRVKKHLEIWQKKKRFAREEAKTIFSELTEVIMDGLYDPDHPNAWGERIFLQELLFPSSFYDMFYNNFFRHHFELLAVLVMGITGRDNREEAILLATTFFGQMISFRIKREMLMRSLDMAGFSKEENEKMKSLVIGHISLILDPKPQ